MEDKILEQGVVEIAIENVQSLSHEDYALVRKNYFGASDSSILCGVNLYKSLDDLIKEKNCKYLTEEEKAVGEKPIVRKGYDLEPIILQKAETELNTEIHKPKDMYKFKSVDGLSINFDGVIEEEGKLVPVEAKLVSKYGEKYYNKLVDIKVMKIKTLNVDINKPIDTYIKQKALLLGIPAYYYTQVQQEIAALNAPYGYLAALFDESWTFKLFYIPRDERVIDVIYNRCEENITKIKRDTE